MMITVYSTENCMKCHLTKRLFAAAGVPITEAPASNPTARRLIQEHGYTTAPIVHVVYPDGTETSWSGMRKESVQDVIRFALSPTELAA